MSTKKITRSKTAGKKTAKKPAPATLPATVPRRYFDTATGAALVAQKKANDLARKLAAAHDYHDAASVELEAAQKKIAELTKERDEYIEAGVRLAARAAETEHRLAAADASTVAEACEGLGAARDAILDVLIDLDGFDRVEEQQSDCIRALSWLVPALRNLRGIELLRRMKAVLATGAVEAQKEAPRAAS